MYLHVVCSSLYDFSLYRVKFIPFFLFLTGDALLRESQKIAHSNLSKLTLNYFCQSCLSLCFGLYSKACLKRPLKTRYNKGLKDKW